MRIAITGDTHLNNNTYQIIDQQSGLYVKSLDALNAFEWFGSEAIKNKVDRIVVLGDLYNHPDPTDAVRRRANATIQKVVAAGIQVVILTGNHDFCSKYHALESLKGWSPLVKIMDEPFIETGIAAYIPHTFDIECERTNFHDSIASLPNGKGPQPKIFFGHFAVHGAMRDNHSIDNSGSSISAAEIVGTGAEIAFLAHFHKYQRIKADIPIFYCGSIENHRMDDMDGKRGFFIYDTEDGDFDFVDYPHCRPMHSIEVDSVESAVALFSDGEWEGSIVRIEVIGDNSNFIDVRTKFAEVKRAFASAGGIHIYCKDGTGKKDNKEVSKVEIESIDDIDVMGILRAEIESEAADDEQRDACLSLLAKVHEEETSK